MTETTHARIQREGPYERMLFAIALTAGTACSIFSKLMMELTGIGRDGRVQSFDRPLALTWGMFVGMIIGLPIHYAVVWFKLPFPGYRHTKRATYQGSNEEAMHLLPISASVENPDYIPSWMYFYLAIPAMFDLVATAFSMIGLLYLDVSVYQLLRGSGIVFVAILKQTMLNQRLYTFQWIGVGWNVVAITLVGLAAVLNASSEPKYNTDDTMIGIFFMLLATFIQSLQFVFEEKVMTTDAYKVPPLLLFGMEGFWGTFICTVILTPIAMLIPGSDSGSFENPINTWALLKNSSTIQIMFGFYVGAIFAYNMFAVLITLDMSSVWHSILDNFRPVTVWATDLVIFYFVTNGHYGEAWNRYSWVQLVGLVVLLYGTLIFNAPDPPSIRLEGQWYVFGIRLTHEYVAIVRERYFYIPVLVKWLGSAVGQHRCHVRVKLAQPHT